MIAQIPPRRYQECTIIMKKNKSATAHKTLPFIFAVFNKAMRTPSLRAADASVSLNPLPNALG